MSGKRVESSKKDFIKITQIKSAIGRKSNQRATLIGLKLNKIGRSSQLPSTPEVLGMVSTVRHLVKVENI